MPYREERHLQAIHWAHVWRAGPRLDRAGARDAQGPAARVGRHRALGRRPRATSRLYRNPQAAALEARFDARARPDGRRWMYHRMLERPDLMREYGAPGVPRWERAGLPVMLPLVRRLIARRTDADDDARRPSRATACGRCSTRSATRLSDGRPLPRAATRFSAADLAFAALAAAVLVPPRYGVPLPPLDELPEPFADEVRAMREHPAGRFALRLYDQERP